MNCEQFVEDYANALKTQDWARVKALIHPNATVTFSSGSTHKGIEEIGAAYQRNFSLIKNGEFFISKVHWVIQKADFAVYTFDFDWKGIVQGNTASGSGKGTTTIIRILDRWQLLAEHLGPSDG